MNHRVLRLIGSLLCCAVLCLPASAKTIYVDADATDGQNTGVSWQDAYTSLAAAIESASSGDEVWVAEGTYSAITLKDGVKLYGGFAGSEASVAEANPLAHKTYISGGTTSRAVKSIGAGAATIVRGFHVTNGFSDIPDMGAGVYLENSSAVFVRCVFTANRSKFIGGAVMIWGGSPTFVNCRFHDNDGGWAAGAVFSRMGAKPTFVNCLFDGNTAQEAGAVSIHNGEPTFVNCTFSGNQATVGMAGALFDAPARAVLRNCILWDNVSPVSGTSEVHSHAKAKGSLVTNSIVKGGWPGEGNLDQDPLFVDAANGDFRIQAASPCRDKGVNAALPADVADLGLNGNTTETLPLDLDLKARVYGDSVDIGAFEWHP